MEKGHLFGESISKAQTTCKFIDVYLHFRPVDALRGGDKGSPRDNTLISESESCTVERLMTVSSWSGELCPFFGSGFFCASYGHYEG